VSQRSVVVSGGQWQGGGQWAGPGGWGGAPQGPPAHAGYFQNYHQRRVRLRSHASNKHVHALQDGWVDANGGDGNWATWILHHMGNEIVAFQNCETGRWMRIDEQYRADARGEGGNLCRFRTQRHGNTDDFSFWEDTMGVQLGFNPDGRQRNPSETGEGPHGSFTLRWV